jgi:hypothetical protein
VWREMIKCAFCDMRALPKRAVVSRSAEEDWKRREASMREEHEKQAEAEWEPIARSEGLGSE